MQPRSAGPVLALAFICGALPIAAATFEKQADGIVVPLANAFLKLEVCADDVIRVAYARDRTFFARSSLMAAPKRCGGARFDVTSGAGQATLATARLRARLDLATGAVVFLDAAGHEIAAEAKDGRMLEPAEVQGEKTFHVRQRWTPQVGESLYGLGQQQYGLLDIKGYDIDLHQYNTSAFVPFLVSSRGYGILWDNTSYTRFGDVRPWQPIPATRLYDASGKPGGLTGSYYAGAHFERLVATRVEPVVDVTTPDRQPHPHTRIHPDLPPRGDISMRWEGTLEAETSGDHLFKIHSNSGIKLWLDGRLVVDHWRQGWLPWYDLAKLRLEAGKRVAVKLEWTRDQPEETLQLFWKTPAPDPATAFWSEVGDGVDYYFVYGPDLDKVIAGYRRVTGPAPMMPLWAYGLWQCRERYKTAQESLDVVDGFRSRQIPFDNIVQDWFYWKADQWGSHEFDPERFPDPAGWIRAIHDRHARLMISVWPKFYPNTENAKALRARGFLFERNLEEGEQDWVNFPYTFYDAFSAEARKLFWSQMERELFKKHADAWWMDATEPELKHGPTLDELRSHMHPTAAGTGARVLNAFPLVNSQAVYEGQRTAAPDQRVFILTRSGFAGVQRYATATWSGDITSSWTAMRKQIPAGLGFSIAGVPYWTMDSGGFDVPQRWQTANPRPEDVEEWRELNARWFQFATFVPLLRVHGQFPFREMWQFGGESSPTYATQLKFDRLRYRLLPYIYSLAGGVTQDGGTIMRPLVMDFRDDLPARDVPDQYMFGPALLVNPVTTYHARSRPVYLPRAAGWYDFWTGAALAGGKRVDAPAPFDALPLYVRAGAIVPFGPELQYTGEKPADPITLVVFTGADAAFTLYEDDGQSYAYEKGAASRIPMRWNEATRTLRIGGREGTFPGMLAERSFEIVLVSKDKPWAFSFEPKADRKLAYRGDALETKWP